MGREGLGGGGGSWVLLLGCFFVVECSVFGNLFGLVRISLGYKWGMVFGFY